MSDKVTIRAGNSAHDDMARRIPVDVEHLGIRIMVPLLAGAALLLTFVLGPVVLDIFGLQDTLLSGLVLPVAIALAVAVAYGSDRFLKQRWPSGREILVNDEALVLRDKKQPEQVIAWNGRVNLLTWRFVVARRGRIPKGYYCLAFQLIQDEDLVTVYTFCDPKHFEDIEDHERFTPLASRKTLKDDTLSLRAAGQQRRLLQAEDERWQHGAELTLEDFRTLWALVCEHQPDQVA